MSSTPRPEYRKSEFTVLFPHGRAVHEREGCSRFQARCERGVGQVFPAGMAAIFACCGAFEWVALSYLAISRDRKSTRLNSSHQIISYAVFCLKKKTEQSGIPPDVRSLPESF